MEKILQKPAYTNYTNNSLDASVIEPFTCKSFYDLLSEAHLINEEYYLARVNCIGDNLNIYYCYDAKQLCKYMFETVVHSEEGRKIRVKNFNDPINSKEISEVNFFKLRNLGNDNSIDGNNNTPLRAEPVGNHVTFLESSVFRAKVFREEDALDSLTVNFQFNNTPVKKAMVTKKRLITIISFFITGILTIGLIYSGITYYESFFIFLEKLTGKSFRIRSNGVINDNINVDEFGKQPYLEPKDTTVGINNSVNDRVDNNSVNGMNKNDVLKESSKDIRNADGAKVLMDSKKKTQIEKSEKSDKNNKSSSSKTHSKKHGK